MKMKKTIINQLIKQAKKSNTPSAAIESASDFINQISASRIQEPEVDLSDSMVSLTWSDDDKFINVKFTEHGHFQYVKVKAPGTSFDHGLAAFVPSLQKILARIEPHIT